MLRQTYITIAVSMAFLATISCKNPYRDLDYAIDHVAEYNTRYQHRQDSLLAVFNSASNDSIKFEVADKLQRNYSYHNADSCYKYVNKLIGLSGASRGKLAMSKAHLSKILIQLDSLQKAKKILDSISPDDIPDDDKYVYYFSRYRLLLYNTPVDRNAIEAILQEWANVKNPHADFYYIGKHDVAALEQIAANPESPNEYAKAHYGLGMLKMKQGNEKEAVKHLVESAKTDMEISAKGYSSLYHLSNYLLRKGDVKRAVKYISCTRHDAEYYNFALKIKQINGIEVETLNALIAQERRQKRSLFIITPIIIALLLITVLMLFMLQHSRERLVEVSSIKDKFLTTYMERCVDYLNKVDEYRSDLRHTAKKDGPDAVLAILRKPSFADSEFHKLLNDFDTAFLGIFPDFVDRVNEITKEEFKYSLEADGSMTTNLRILALIRLGITERKKIAKILNMSVGSVYTYHTYLQQRSICSPDEFDKVVKKL